MADQSTYRAERTLQKLLVTRLASDDPPIKANKESKGSNKEREDNSKQQALNHNQLQQVLAKLLQ